VDQDLRSTRLLQEAEQQAAQGKYVMVVCIDFQHAKSMAQQFVASYGGHNGSAVNAKIDYKGGSVTFETKDMLDWETLTFPWTPVLNSVVLIDPRTIEKRYAMSPQVERELHRFD